MIPAAARLALMRRKLHAQIVPIRQRMRVTLDSQRQAQRDAQERVATYRNVVAIIGQAMQEQPREEQQHVVH